MILSDNGGGNFKLAPAGSWSVVCVDFVDLGLVESRYRPGEKQPKCRVVFEGQDEDGEWFIASRRFTASLHEKAELRKALESWRGRSFTPDELKAFDTEQLIGAPALISIVHNQKGERTYDDIVTIARPPKGLARQQPSGRYVRVKDRDAQPAPASAPARQAPPPARNEPHFAEEVPW